MYKKIQRLSDKKKVLIIKFDFKKKDELMGKCFIKPLVQKDHNNPPKLKWYKIFYGNEQAGDILASFELLLVCFFNLP